MLATVPPPVIPNKPTITSTEDALSILLKFKDLHRYNIYNTRRKLDNLGIYKPQSTEKAEYENYYDKNKEIVLKQLDETNMKYQVLNELQKPLVMQKLPLNIKKSESQHILPTIDPQLEVNYDVAGRLIIKNQELADKLIGDVANYKT